MNSDYEQTLDKNFDKALELCSNAYSYDELMNFLKNGNIPEKQFAALEINELHTPEDTQIFISNLTGCDGKIREAVAQKFSELVSDTKYRDFFSNFPETFAKATIDINANISRMVIEGLELMSDKTEFGERYTKTLINYIYEAFEGLDKIVFRDKKYTVNKQLFKLYWCLEGLNNYYRYLPITTLKDILTKSLEQKEYTIREKVAQILSHSNLNDKELENIIKSDQNYYVKKFIS